MTNPHDHWLRMMRELKPGKYTLGGRRSKGTLIRKGRSVIATLTPEGIVVIGYLRYRGRLGEQFCLRNYCEDMGLRYDESELKGLKDALLSEITENGELLEMIKEKEQS